MMRKLFFILLALVTGNLVIAQQNPVVLEYINTYKQLAIDEMQRTGVPAAIKLAQGIHETEAGRSELVMKSNNHFGIKCKTSWTGGKVYHDDDARGECFRSYLAPDESYRDHSNFLRSNQRYGFLFRLDPTDYKAWAYGLKKAGYATNIKYSQLLIKLIETYDLQQYSLIAMGKLPPTSDLLTGIRPPAETVPVDATPPIVYPQGTFEINDTKVVFVKAGTSLLALANQYQISLSRLLEFNDMTPDEGDILVEDQLVFLHRKRKTGTELFHYVKAGETLYGIAQAQGIRYESLLELNHLSAGMEPAAGERLFLREKSPSRPVLAGSVITATTVSGTQAVFTTHIVRNKETLYGISRRYGVSLHQLIEWNKLNGADLRTGQELIIYTN
ncbi:glucosaminidase domain-containing protein [Flavihumibacter stibioxidans]|nr:glucosaminidase domain-containing protein [Flavihumibacter stibioxidans]